MTSGFQLVSPPQVHEPVRNPRPLEAVGLLEKVLSMYHLQVCISSFLCDTWHVGTGKAVGLMVCVSVSIRPGTSEARNLTLVLGLT